LATNPSVTLVLGGARSGKSEWAERLASALPQPVTYVATAGRGAVHSDPDFAARIEAHRRRRPATWTTIESDADLIDVLAGLEGTVLVDALGTWVAAVSDFAVDTPGLCAVLRARTAAASTVVVSEEVGLGVHPYTAAGGHFRDVMGVVNRAVADVADEVLLVVAGRALRLDASIRPATTGED
jgi:adenosyl cobinamide kinase/adenosyl cobinamide phosphate guanylyltransferase